MVNVIILGIFSNLNDSMVSPQILLLDPTVLCTILGLSPGHLQYFLVPGLYPQPLQISAMWESEFLGGRMFVCQTETPWAGWDISK